MNWTHPAVVGTVLCAGAFAVGTQIHGPADAQAKAGPPIVKMSAEQRCEQALIRFHYQAGDLCDTLRPAVDITERKWRQYNEVNGWEWIGSNPYWHDPKTGKSESGDCWDTAATTDKPYILCWDGTLMRIPATH